MIATKEAAWAEVVRCWVPGELRTAFSHADRPPIESHLDYMLSGAMVGVR